MLAAVAESDPLAQRRGEYGLIFAAGELLLEGEERDDMFVGHWSSPPGGVSLRLSRALTCRRRCCRHIPQRRGDFVAATADIVNRPHALGLEYGLRHEGFSILAQIAEFEDYVGQVPAVIKIVKALEARIMDRIVLEDRLAGRRAERDGAAVVLHRAAGARIGAREDPRKLADLAESRQSAQFLEDQHSGVSISHLVVRFPEFPIVAVPARILLLEPFHLALIDWIVAVIKDRPRPEQINR